MEKRYLIINWTETREKNHAKSGSDLVYDFLVEKGMSFKLLGLSGESFVKEANDNEIIIDIYNKGEYRLKLGEETKIVYSDGYQVCGDWIDEYSIYLVKYSDKTLKEIEDSLPPLEIKDNILIKVNSRDSKIVVPEGVVEIEYRAFSRLNVQEVVLPSTIKKIGMCAFNDCKYLTKINLPEGVEFIGSFAFSYTGIEDIKLPNSIKCIDDYAFSGTKFYEKYKDKEFEILGDGLLYKYNGHCSEVILPDEVKIICPLAFSQNDKYCSSLTNYFIKKITLPDNLKIICDKAFFRLKSLNEINLNTNIEIHKNAFAESVYEEKYQEFLRNNGK